MLQPAPLTPMPLGMLLGRIAHEWDTRKRIFDLPTARFWKPDADVDLSFEFLGRRAATPIGPAAGPHSQMAQNIVLSWLGGSRLFELKTIQVLDDLDIARPCIDMQTIGYNIEWSQELLVHQSIEEYVKAWMIIEVLRRWEPLTEFVGEDPGPHVFDMSVGYDLAGITTPKVAGFISSMHDASSEIERLRPEIADEPTGTFGAFADIPIPSCISTSVTLSTFHGCPPDEIEAITKHLIDDHDLDVIVKLNPTLLGPDRVDEIVHRDLGYADVRLVPAAFEADLQFDRAVELIADLNRHAKDRGHRFGIKLTNTLVVANHKQWMPEDTMYLSGPPLHVLATAVLDALSTALPHQLMIPGHEERGGDIQVSFSAGVCKENLADTLAMGVRPATICSDLLKPGGYGRLAPMLKALADTVRADIGVAAGESVTSGSADADHRGVDLGRWRQWRLDAAIAANHRDTVDEHLSLVRGVGIGQYHHDGNQKLPRAVEHDLEMWGCVACNFCVTVCPNDAFFKLPTPKDDAHFAEISGRQQYLVLSELCNECGNCLTFCPENGDPAIIKPRLYLDRDRFDAADGQRFLVTGGHEVTVTAAGGADQEIPTLVALLTATEGFPVVLSPSRADS